MLATTIGGGEDKIYWALNKCSLYEVSTGYRVAYGFSHPPIEFCPEIETTKFVAKTVEAENLRED